jgi:hypothetical protein
MRSVAIFSFFLASACFSVEHRLPPQTYFGQLPKGAGERAATFQRGGHKNWFLAGLGPYSSWSSRNLLATDSSAKRIEAIAIETEFDAFDVVVSVVPGMLYGYYVWAPRSIRVSGTEIRPEP